MPAVLEAKAAGVQFGAARYAQNLRALYAIDPKLACRIDAAPFAEGPSLEPTRTGAPTCRLTTHDGRNVFVHSRHDPVAESRRLTEPAILADPSAYTVFGLGLGYAVAELTDRRPDALVIVVEPHLAMIKAALTLHDLSEALTRRRLIFLTEARKNRIHDQLWAAHAEILLGLQIIRLPHTASCDREFYETQARLLADFTSCARLQLTTLLRNARITARNLALNLPAYLASGGVESLRGRAAGYPAIIVAAGPSLRRNLDLLLQAHDRAVTIAVQTVFKLLVALRRPPHFVTSLDFHEVSAEFFRDLPSGCPTTLVADPKVAWQVLDAYDGPKRMFNHRFMDDVLREVAPRRSEMRSGSTVAHLAYHLALHLGCDPIIFVGQDLCHSDGLFYFPGSPIEQIWAPELNRFCTIEMKQWERVARNRPILRRIRDIRGEPAYTDDQLFTYAEQFQTDFLSQPQRIIQATEGGMPLAGAQVMSLREALDTYCKRSLPPNLFSTDDEPASGDFTAAAAAVRQRLEEVHTLRQIAGEMLDHLKQLGGLLDRPAEFNRVVARVDALRVRVQRYERTFRMVTDVAQTAELRRLNADRRIGRVDQETSDTARQRLARDREFVEAFRDGCDYLTSVLEEAAERLERSAK